MITKDINLHESGSGGEFSIVSNDLLFGESLYNQVYLALFGGNVEANTIGNELISEQRFDWWGNPLFFSEVQSKQFNSNTERALQTVVLNSSGRLTIIQAVNTDLEYLTRLLNYTIDVSFPKENHILIEVKFRKKDNLEDKVLQLLYNNAKDELIIEKII